MTAPETKAHNFPCKGCAASIAFDPAAGGMKCPHCGFSEAIPQSEEEIKEYSFKERLVRPKSDAPAIEGRTIRCDRCSATFEVSDSALSGACGYCGSTVLVPVEAASDRIAPEAVQPFRVSNAQAGAAFRKWVESRWFAPTAFRRVNLAERLVGVYRPHWTFDSHTVNHYTGERGDYYYVTVGMGKNRRTERRVRWTWVSGSFSRFFDDVLVRGCRESAFATSFPMASMEKFDMKFLSGYESESYSVEPEEGWKEAKAEIRRQVESEAAERIGGDTQRNVQVTIAHTNVTFKLVMLPLYMSAFEFRGKSFPVQVNGETGEVAGRRPWSFWKIFFLVVGLLAAAAAGVLALFAMAEGR
jgi:DNA-directed RNA polymerase subunit RPC12/RpoP